MTVDFDTLDKNTHFTFYVTMKLPPEKRYTKTITRETHLSYNTILEKLKTLLEMNLLKRRRDGLRLQYFPYPGVKKQWKEWSETENGKELVTEFEQRLSTKNERPTTEETAKKEKTAGKSGRIIQVE